MASMSDLSFKYINAGDARILYIEAGSPSLPTLLLLHGFPSCALQYRSLIAHLHKHYHILAPTFPGFGSTEASPTYTYSFASLSLTLSAFLTALDVHSYAVYVFDYGAPVLFRLALNPPPDTNITAIISQNGNAYLEGFGRDFWAPVFALWVSGNGSAEREYLRENFLTLEATENQYRAGVPDEKQALIDPSTYTLDYLENLAPASGRQDLQLDLLYDYRTNADMYPKFHTWFRKSQVPLLAVWGKGDPAFVPAGAEAFRRDSPGAKVRFLDTGHFAVATDAGEIAREVRQFLGGIGYQGETTK